MGCLVESVAGGSPAEAAGIRAGWRLLRIDNRELGDIIDYKIAEADTRLVLLFLTDRGTLRRIRIKKGAAVSLGLGFNPPTIKTLQCCRNNCIFCFIDQNPPGLRAPLYIKDDDYRLSFLYGNFITLNHLAESDFKRIVKLQLSPVYVSVQSTNPLLRKKMFRSKEADRGRVILNKLVNAGIRVHAQVVLCPGYNTGKEMLRTLEDLHLMGPNLLSVALVPAGLTAFRSRLTPLQRFGEKDALDLLEQLDSLQNRFLHERKSRFVYAADEIYNLAGIDVPPCSYYEHFPQLENGVGLARQFLDQLKVVEEKAINKLPAAARVTILSGLAAKNQIEKLAEVLSQIKNLTVETVYAKNAFFGNDVTVSGLLTGRDVVAALEGISAGSVVFIPRVMLRDKSALFLDDTTVADIETMLEIKILAATGPVDLLEKIEELSINKA